MLIQKTLKADLASPRALALRLLLFLSSSVALRRFLDILIVFLIAVKLGVTEPYSQCDPWTFRDWKELYEMAALRVIWVPSTALIFACTFFDISFNPPQILQLQLAEIDRIEKTLHDDATEEKLRFDALFKEELLSIIKAQAQDALLKEELLSIIKAQAQDREHREPILHWLEGQYGSTEIAPRFRESVPESAPESAGSSEDERFAESGNDLSERAAEKKRGQ